MDNNEMEKPTTQSEPFLNQIGNSYKQRQDRYS